MIKKVYLATRNEHKVEELMALIPEKNLQILPAHSLNSDIGWIEDGATFLENARIKALELKKYTNEPVLADDSGLVVEALDGAPGIYSSRYAGVEGDSEANMAKLLNELGALPLHERAARFVCVLVYIDENNNEFCFEGEVSGRISFEKKGAFGFGYDPIFLVGDGDKTMAELKDYEKNQISHRFRATSQWLQLILSQ
jgi:XTP/dITP diphosphohydrolase